MFGRLPIIVVASGLCSPVWATNFWLSPSGNVEAGSQPPASPSAIPVVEQPVDTPAGSVFIWGRPDPGKTLANWSLNLLSSNPSVLTLTQSQVAPWNPVLGDTGTPSSKPIVRWENVGEPTGSGAAINGIQGFSIYGVDQVGVGIGPDSTGLVYADPFYNAESNAWLLARVDYLLSGVVGQTDLFLQLGEFGLNNFGESSSETSAVLGALTDTPLNADTDRQILSSTADLTISVVEIDPVTGDYDGNGVVESDDYLVWRQSYGSTTNLAADGNGDSVVDAADYVIWRDNLETTSSVPVASNGSTAPEPSSMLLLFVVGGVFASPGRRPGRTCGQVHG